MNLGQLLHQQKEDLKQFWAIAPELSPTEKLILLQEYSKKLYFHRSKSLGRLRKHFNKTYLGMFKEACFVCDNPCEHRHHIVQLSRGGINSKLNRIPLCKDHHQQIHPWIS